MLLRNVSFTLLAALCLAPAFAAPVAPLPIEVGGNPWLQTQVTPFDPKDAETTYKVYTEILSFDGKSTITKGPGGKYTHHRGLYLGWKDTLVDGQDLDTWHMSNSIQQLNRVVSNKDGEQALIVDWKSLDGKPFIEEQRTISARAEGDLRVIDFSSTLTALEHEIQLKGDLQHAGMQIRMAQEVAEHEATTQYILPAGAQTFEDDKVTGAWWACCSCEVGGKRYWVLHLSSPSTPGGVPVYSIRKYARFGAFFEPTLKPKTPLPLHFRVIVSERELDQVACQALYDAYAKERP